MTIISAADTADVYLDILAKSFRAICTRMVKLYPLATTICVNPAIFKASAKSVGRALFCPVRKPTPKLACGSGMTRRTLSANQSRTTRPTSPGTGRTVFVIVLKLMLAGKLPNPSPTFPLAVMTSPRFAWLEPRKLA